MLQGSDGPQKPRQLVTCATFSGRSFNLADDLCVGKGVRSNLSRAHRCANDLWGLGFRYIVTQVTMCYVIYSVWPSMRRQP